MYAGGNGTKEFPYKISDRNHFEHFLKSATGKRHLYYALLTDIQYETNVSIEDFDGNFDGNGYCISGIEYSFINDNKGTVDRLKLANGKICRINNGLIRQCYSSHICDTNNSVINHCISSYKNVFTNNCAASYGGICNVNSEQGRIEYCVFIGNISQTICLHDTYTGCVCSENKGTIIKSLNVGNIQIKSYDSFANKQGGICGYNYKTGIVSECVNVAKIEGNGSYTGGISGKNIGTILHCLYNKNVNISAVGRMYNQGKDNVGITEYNLQSKITSDMLNIWINKSDTFPYIIEKQ